MNGIFNKIDVIFIDDVVLFINLGFYLNFLEYLVVLGLFLKS